MLKQTKILSDVTLNGNKPGQAPDADLPFLATRVFALRGQKVHDSLDQAGLESVFGTLLVHHSAGSRDYQKYKHGFLQRLADTEMSASLGGELPKKENKAPKPSNPADPAAALREIGGRYLEWMEKSLSDTHFINRLREANELLDAHGHDHYAEFFMDCFADFKTHLMLRIMPVYNKEYIEFWPTFDQWTADNIKTRDAQLLSIFYDRGAENALTVMNNLAPADAPGMR